MHARHQAVIRAREYVLNSLKLSNLWSDFLTYAGQSDEWVTAFVGLRLMRGGLEPTRLLVSARRLLRRQRLSGGWGYNEFVPEDADSTACVLLMLQQIVPDAIELLSGHEFLLRHQRPEGFTTYHNPIPLRRYLGLDGGEDLSGWDRTAHLCVTAYAALALRHAPLEDERYQRAVEFALDALRAAQGANGSWETYWWRTPMYTTTAALEALAGLGGECDVETIARGLDWIARMQRADGSWDGGDDEGAAFVTGLALQALSPHPQYANAWERGVEWLLRHQRGDGSWDPCPILQIPPPWVSDAREVRVWKRGGLGVPVCIADQYRLFTTSVCFAALSSGTERVQPPTAKLTYGGCHV